MSTTPVQTAPAGSPLLPAERPNPRRPRLKMKRLLLPLVILAAAAVASWYGARWRLNLAAD